MNLTSKQKNELVVWEHFIPRNVAWQGKTDEDMQRFFEWSQEGKHRDVVQGDTSYFEALRQGKRWAGVHMGMFEEGVLEGSMPYMEILGSKQIVLKRKWWQLWKPRITWEDKPVPREVVDFMKKEMFKGIDVEIIEKCYQEITKGEI